MSLQGAYQAIVEGRHDDPFSILGEHQGHVTVYWPFVEKLSILPMGKRKPIEMARDADFPDIFKAEIDAGKDYKLIGEKDGRQWEMRDAYRYGPVLGEMDVYLIGEGTHQRLWQAFGAHPIKHEGMKGVHFAVWAPNAQRVSVLGEFNFWDGRRHVMRRLSGGIWEIFIPELGEGDKYKFEIRSSAGELMPLKADPVGFGSEHPPATASVVRDLSKYKWKDKKWMGARQEKNRFDQPISIYEVHLGSWKRKVEDGNRSLSYLEFATELVDYASDMGFTHIELMPISEYPFDGSWGYQPIGLYAPTIRFGTPDELRSFMDRAHQKNLAVLLDWVPGHFPSDAHGLMRFDGTALYEHADPKEGFHQDWNTLIYNYGRTEVSNFLISNALYWMEEFHLDGLRVDAVASMLYRDYSRDEGQWVPNKDGGRENYEAIAFMQNMNTVAYAQHPNIMTVAEESTSFPKVSRPVSEGGLGFGYKWNMGWMNDTLSYMEEDPVHRKYHHNKMTFGLHYAWSENFILPLSHDEVVHGKGSMLAKMPGNREEQFANLRGYYGFMFGHPGKKLLFMGMEFAQDKEWDHENSLDWHLLEYPEHKGVQNLIRDLNTLYTSTPALYKYDTDPKGFEWLEINDADNSVFAWLRKGDDGEHVVVVSNFTPVERPGYRVGLPMSGVYEEIINTDAQYYGGGNRGNLGEIQSEDTPWHNQTHSAALYLPPLSTLILKPKQ